MCDKLSNFVLQRELFVAFVSFLYLRLKLFFLLDSLCYSLGLTEEVRKLLNDLSCHRLGSVPEVGLLCEVDVLSNVRQQLSDEHIVDEVK